MVWGDGVMGFGFVLAGLLGLLVMIGVVVLVVVAVALATRGRGPGASSGTAPRPRAPGSESAREVLEMRYARGEIDTKEFNERRKALDAD